MPLPNAAPTQPTTFPATQATHAQAEAPGFCTSAGPSSSAQENSNGFVDRRRQGGSTGNNERRQFGSSHDGLSEPGRELALAIDQYKLQHHRRYITCDEMLHVITSLGYSK